jgi:hypothetical protein
MQVKLVPFEWETSARNRQQLAPRGRCDQSNLVESRFVQRWGGPESEIVKGPNRIHRAAKKRSLAIPM